MEEDRVRFCTVRDGDHLMMPFQCSDCYFFNLRGRRKIEGHPSDDLLFKCICCATLDSFWARERSTVASNLGKTRKFLKTQELLGNEHHAFPNRGPYPEDNNWGMHVACGLLLRSLDPGKIQKMFSSILFEKLGACTPI